MTSTSEMNPSVPLPSEDIQSDEQPFHPLREFIFKVNSRCNLACSYCYMHEHADQSWREQPIEMSPATILKAATRIADHTEEHSVDQVFITFHGGEPLLNERRDPDFYPWATGVLRNIIGSVIDKDNITFLMQTNGTLITPSILEKMQRLGIRMGVSTDGATPETHNMARRYRNGTGSFAEVRRALRLLQKPLYRDIYGGLISVIDPTTNPTQVYNGLKSFSPPLADLLLPLAHWDMPPPHSTQGETPYADWLIAVYDRQRKDKEPMQIRMFNEIITMLEGGAGSVEYLGFTAPANVVIETDGQIQLVDALKSVAHGAPATGLNVSEHSFNDLLRHPKARPRILGRLALADDCNRCDIVKVCGGGYQPHRFREGSDGDGFKNTSVYCADLKKLIDHISSRVHADIRDARLKALAQPAPSRPS